MSGPIPPPPVMLPNLPAGWSRGRVPSPAVLRAREVLRMPYQYGGGLVDTIEGVTYAFRREPHFDNHPKLKPGQDENAPDAPPKYWHPGISVWTMTDPSAAFPPGLDDVRPRTTPIDTGKPLPILVPIALFAVGVAAGYLLSRPLGKPSGSLVTA